MRILVVNGAPRKNGHTRDLVDLFCKGITAGGGQADVIHLREHKVHPCQGCYHCWTREKDTAACILHDDMPALIERFYEADVLILATPIYFYTFSAHLKIFLERLLPVTKPELELARTYDLMKNTVLDKERGPKGVGLIAVAGHKGQNIMDGILPTFNLIAEGLGAKSVGKILRTESFFLDFPHEELTTVKRIQAAVTKAGTELVEVGHISQKTERETAMPLTQNVEQFSRHFQTYWEIAKELNASGKPLRNKLKRAVKYDLRVLMPELARFFDPTAMGDGEAVLLFRFTGKQPGVWHGVISRAGCEVFPGVHEKPTLTISTTSEIFVSILIERKDPARLAKRGKLQVTGDLHLFQRFYLLFPPPSRR